MKHPLFENLEIDYPVHLEQHHDHILRKMDKIWDTPEIHDYLSDLLIDKRGGRKGFSPEVTNEIIALREYRAMETFRAAERKEVAIQELTERGIFLSRADFLNALQKGEQQIIDLFVRAGFDIHFNDEDGNPPLLFALKRGYTVIAKILLVAGADVNEKDRLGLTPLMVTCGKSTRGYKEVAEVLIKKGAQINVRDTLGFTPLLLSLSGGNIDIAAMLIEHGADVNAHTRKGETPIMLARKANSPELVDLLLSKGATE
jgi:ankyrin repeat protein